MRIIIDNLVSLRLLAIVAAMFLKRRTWLILVGLIALSILPTRARAQDPAFEVLLLVNSLRAEYGLAPFAFNAALANAALNQAGYMAATGIYSHTGWNGSTPQTRATAAGYQGWAAENIVGGTGLTPAEGVLWWENSPVHLNQMISTRHIHAGTAYANGLGQNFYVLVIGVPSENAPTEVVQEPDSAPIYVAPIILAEPNEDGAIIHTIEQGQTLWVLASRYDVELDDILTLNGIDDNDLVNPGDEIIISLPPGVDPPPTATPPKFHVVQSGETPWEIAAEYDLSLTELYWFNNLREDALIRPGDELIVRLDEGEAPPPTPTPPLTHVISSGDTLLGIALRYGLTVNNLVTYNSISEDTILQIGTELYIRPLATPTAEALQIAEVTPTPTTEVVAAAPANTLEATLAPTHEIIPAGTLTPTITSQPPPATPAHTPTPSSTTDLPSPTGLVFLGMGLVAAIGYVFIYRRG